MNAVLNKPLHSLGTFACETAGAPMKGHAAVRVAKLVLAGVLAVPAVGLAVAAVADASVFCGLLALALATWPVVVFIDATKGCTADPTVLDEHADAVAKRDHHWRYFNPDNTVAPLNRVRQHD